MKILRIALAGILLITSGCGTLTGGFFYKVKLTSSEPDTDILVYRKEKLVKKLKAPNSKVLSPWGMSAGDSYKFEFRKEGFEPWIETRWRYTNDLHHLNLCFMAFFIVGALPPYLLDWITGADGEFQTEPIHAQLIRTPRKIDMERLVPKITSTWDWQQQVQSLGLKASFCPNEVEHPISPLARDLLIGTWQGSKHHADICKVNKSGKVNQYATQYDSLSSWDFKDDGSYTSTIVVNASPGVKGSNSVVSGQWFYENGLLTLIPKMEDEKGSKTGDAQKWVVTWFSEDAAAIRRSEPEKTAWWLRFAKNHQMFKNQREDVSFKRDVYGCDWLSLTYLGMDGSQEEIALSSPEHFKRVSRRAGRFQQSSERASYKIVACERESNSDFAYRFSIELSKDTDQSLAAFRGVQKEFREAILSDYLESFPRADKKELQVDFPMYRQVNGRIEGRAVVLTISVVSLSYDSNTRKGILAVRFGDNQYVDAREWVRKNIETLARDKNIALTTGEIPPAAKFYLGREEIKDGNILEVEFKTE